MERVMTDYPDDISDFMADHGGVATVSELAGLLEEDEGYVRRWARDNDVRRCGSTFVFSEEKALQLGADLEDAYEGDDDLEDDEDDEDEDDED
jgi:hypothetical protein